MAGGDANGHVPAKRAHRHPCVGNTLRAVWAPWSSGGRQTMEANSSRISRKSMKADSTLRTSRAVPHPSTNRALCRLTSEVERDPVHSTRYGRQRKHPPTASNSQSCKGKAPTNRVLFSPLLQPRQNVVEGLEGCITTQTGGLGCFQYAGFCLGY